MKKIILLFFILVNIAIAGTSQTLNYPNIYGKVLSIKNGRPLPGVSVMLKKSNTGSVSDNEGNFSLMLKEPSDTLIISHIGFITKRVFVPHDNTKPLVIRLKATVSSLNGVVVSTGFQDIPKARATGSFDFINSKTLNEQAGTDILSRLESVANGLYVDRTTNNVSKLPVKLMIRGLSTINGPKDPLVIVDNFPYAGDINNINPNEVESITILKDAAAASIWGTQAGNGVIVINLKKGKFRQAVRTDVRAKFTIINKPDLFYPSRISTSDEIDVERYLFNQGYELSDTSSYSKPVISPVYEILINQQDGRISQSEATKEINALRNIDLRRQFLKYFYQKAFNQQYSVNLSGGSRNFSWLFFTGYDKNVDQLSNKYNRLNLRWSDEFKPFKNLSIHTGIYYTITDQKSGKPGYGTIRSNIYRGIYPYARLASPQGKPVALAKDYRQSVIDTMGGGNLLDWHYYPLDDYKHNVAKNQLQDITLNVGLDYHLLKDLDVNLMYEYEKGVNEGNTLHDMQSYFTRNLINLYTNLSQTDASLRYPVPMGDIADLSTNDISSQSFRGQINYNPSWRNARLSLIAGWQIIQHSSSTRTSRIYGYNPDNLNMVVPDYVGEYTTNITGFLGQVPNIDYLQGLLNRQVSTYANGAYTYKKKYTLSLSARRDASNLFGVSTNNKWKPLWSSGLSWNISREGFYKSSFLPYLKARATYGKSGNADPSRAGVTTIRYFGTSPYTESPYATFSNYDNPNLRWETSAQFNLGIDFGIKNDILDGSIDYYHKKNTDLISTAPIDYTGGVGPQIEKNAANTSGNGVDIKIDSRNIRGKFQWNTDFNFSYNKDKVDKYYLSDKNGTEFVNTGANVSAIEGRPVYAIYSYKWGGLDPQTGDPQGYIDGKISEDYSQLTEGTTINDLIYNGPALPTIFGSLGNTFSWEGLSLTVRLNYKFGYYFFKDALSYGELFMDWTGSGDYAKRWQKPGDEKYTSVPSMVYPIPSYRDDFYQGSEVNVLNGDFIRLQYITLTYKPNLKRFNFKNTQSIKFYGNINNVGLIWTANKEGIDPEYRSAPPPPVSFTLGVEGSF